MSFVERSIILCPYLGGSTIGGSTVYRLYHMQCHNNIMLLHYLFYAIIYCTYIIQLGRRVNLCKHYQHINTSSQEYHHPEIIHYVKLTRTPDQNILTFQEYVSILSAHKFYKPQKIIIHCNRQPFTGPYWDRVANLSTPIELRHTKRVKSINNRGVGFIEHEADYIKVTTAYTEGGIYMDFDVVILNGELLREMQRHSECVIGRDNERCTKICAGFFSSSPRSSFIKNWLEGYKTDYRPSDWVYNAGDVPSNLLRKCPTCYNVTVDSHMSNWEDRDKWLKPGQLNWRIKSVAHYMNAGFMKPLKEPEELLKMSTPITEMIKYVLDS